MHLQLGIFGSVASGARGEGACWLHVAGCPLTACTVRPLIDTRHLRDTETLGYHTKCIMAYSTQQTLEHVLCISVALQAGHSHTGLAAQAALQARTSARTTCAR